MKAGDDLEVYIFGFLFILILIPILYIVPIGFNKKEKVLIAGLSFILAEVGMLVNKFLPLWKAILIMLLFALIATYFYETRLRSRFEKGKDTNKRSLKGQLAGIDLPGNEFKMIDKPQDDEVQKDFGDYNLGQDAIDRLLFEKKQAELIQDSDSLAELPSNLATEEPISENENLDHIEEQSGVIEDSYNNTELFSDFDEAQQLEEDRQAIISEQDETEVIAVNEPEMQPNTEEQHEDETQLEIVDATEEQDVLEILSDEILSNEVLQNESIGSEDVDLEDLVSGQRFDNDDDVGKDSIHTSDTAEPEDNEVELLQRRSALFEELEGESIIENADLFSEEEAEKNESVIEEILEEAESEPQDIENEIELEENIQIEKLEKVNKVETEDNNTTDHIIEDMEVLEVIDEIQIIDENSKNTDITEDDIPSLKEEHEIEKISETIMEDITPQIKDDYEEILDKHEYISTSENTENSSKIGNDVEEKTDILNKVIEQVNQPKETKTQQQMVQTMLDYINVSKRSLSAGEYEDLVRAHMHSELSDHDYYTFAYLLIEHYISHGKSDELFDLLKNLDSKFSKYPVLKQQINYLIERYC
ncbi:hypothetical protein BAZO_12299 [Schinkia azotoformans LMG 9581]|uniref:Uncharacterized protein n=1 Tax=Schinkia azotoformans LMG 9581 TaxID=1131731 RepID=K6CXP3_SCHAZ|nr:hypothetical protein BAZO_12299 [Schinkia azotoformans LMG 9581]